MGIFTNLPIRQVFKQARRFRTPADTPCRSALCVARQRLGVEPVRHLFEGAIRPLATPEIPGAFYCDVRLVAVDGTFFSFRGRPLPTRRCRPFFLVAHSMSQEKFAATLVDLARRLYKFAFDADPPVSAS